MAILNVGMLFLLKTIKKEWFLSGMVAMIALAAIAPDLGKTAGVLKLDELTGIGIALVFFLHGVGLSPKAIKGGISNWRLHLFIQSTTFVAYPLIWLLTGHTLQIMLPAALALGFCYLFVLPSTISSSVAMTSVAGGNVPGAIFNASLSSVLGIVITPLLVQLFMGMGNAQMDIMHTVISISKLLLLPMILGQLFRPVLSSVLNKHKSIVNKLDKYVILMIVLNAFSDSMVQRIWAEFSLAILLLTVLVCSVILLFVAHAIKWMAQKFGFNTEDEIAALFCGTKKTLAAGVPMAKVIFGADPNLGMILLPIMLYHPIQIFYCATLANGYVKRDRILSGSID